jgi:hypothetical protein
MICELFVLVKKRFFYLIFHHFSNRLVKLVERIGDDITEFKMIYIPLTDQSLRLLSLMPNLETLSMMSVRSDNLKVSDNFRLELKKLRALRVDNCDEKVLEILNRLPDGILNEIIWNRKSKTDKKNFSNQWNIQSVKGTYVESLDLSCMKLKTLVTSQKDRLLQEMFKGQNEMVSFHIYFEHLFDDDLNFIITEAINLENVSLSYRSSTDLSALKNLKRLKKLIIATENGGIETIKSESLQELSIESKDIFQMPSSQVSANCPNVRRLQINLHHQSLNLDPIFQHFPKLEELSVCGIDLTIQQSLIHEKLEKFRLITLPTAVHLIEVLLNIVRCCSRLKSLVTDIELDSDSFMALLSSTTKIKAIRFAVISTGIIEAVKDAGKHLEFFQYSSEYQTQSKWENTKSLLKDQFDEFVREDGVCILRKRRPSDEMFNLNFQSLSI